MGWMMGCYDDRCGARIVGRDADDVERKAAAAGWKMGLMLSAQAYYTCPDCAPGLLGCVPIIPAKGGRHIKTGK